MKSAISRRFMADRGARIAGVCRPADGLAGRSAHFAVLDERSACATDAEFPLSPALSSSLDRATAAGVPAPAAFSITCPTVGGQAKTAPAIQPPRPAGAVELSMASGFGLANETNPVAKASKDNGRTSATMGAPMTGEASRGSDAADRQRPALPGVTGEDDGRDVEAACGAASVITLSDASAFILSLVAAHQGRVPRDIVAQLIAAAGEAIGLSDLLQRGARDVGCLADLPGYARAAAKRFRSGGP